MGVDPAAPPTDDDDDSAASVDCEGLVPVIETSTVAGTYPLTVLFDSSASCSPVGITEARWDFGPDTQNLVGAQASFTWLGTGSPVVTLTVVDGAGDSAQAQVEITVDEAPCPVALPPVTSGQLGPGELDRASGLAASRVHEGVLWSHNDAGQGSTLFAISETGAEIATFELDAVHTDWEDIAVGRDPSTGLSTVYIGDLGDDDANRDSVRLVMLPEPTAEQLVDPDPGTLVTSIMELTYPDEARADADALMFDPQTGDLYVVARRPGSSTSDVYRKSAPHLPGSTRQLEPVATLDLGGQELPGGDRATAASFNRLGDRLLVRTQGSAFVFLRDASQPFYATFEAAACPVPVPDEEGHEALDFAADGRGFFTVAADPGAYLWFVEFEPPDCDGLEARILAPTGSPYHVPAELTFELDADCVPEGIDQVEWTIDGQVSQELSPTVLLERSGLVEVEATVTDTTGASASGSRGFQLLETPCPDPGPAETWGEVDHGDINEASGVALSTQTDGVLWVHNDSGDSARLFAVSTDGDWLGTWTLDAEARDWEDLAYGWDATLATQVLYVGDVGDNAQSRESITIQIVPEPAMPADGEPAEHTLAAGEYATMELTYPDGASHNCETLMWDPMTGDLYVVTKKVNDLSHVFRKPAPHEHGTSTEVELVTSLRFGQEPIPGSSNTTGGDISPSGDRILIRTYSRVWMWHREPGQTVAEALDNGPCDLDAPDEPQSEAVCFTPDGAGYLTLSEGTNQPIYYVPLLP